MATSSPSSHCSAFGVHVDAEAAQLGLGRRLARAEIDPAARDQVQHGDALGGASRVVVVGGGLDDAVAQADALGALAGRCEEHLGSRRVRVLLEEVVLDLPHVVEPDLVGQLDLVERVLDELLLTGVGPRAGQLVLVEQAELHGEINSVW